MAEEQKKEVKKGFWARFWEKMDKALEAKAQSSCCCCAPKDRGEGKKCC